MLPALFAISTLELMAGESRPADSPFVSLVAWGTETALEVGDEVIRTDYPTRGRLHPLPDLNGSEMIAARFSATRNKWLIGFIDLYEVDGRTGRATKQAPAHTFAYTPSGVLRLVNGIWIKRDPGAYFLCRGGLTRQVPAQYGKPHALSQDGKTIISFDDKTFSHYLLAIDEDLRVKKFKTLRLPDSYADTTTGALNFLAPDTFVYVDGASFGSSQVIRITIGPERTVSEILFVVAHDFAPAPFFLGRELLFTRRDMAGWSLSLVGRTTVMHSKHTTNSPPRIRLDKSGTVLTHKTGRWQPVEWKEAARR